MRAVLPETAAAVSVEAALAVERFADEWGVVDPGRFRRLNRRGDRETDRFLAQYAQALRAEAATGGHRTELRMYFGIGEHDGAGDEQLLTAAMWRREAQLEAEHGRDQPPVHGTAGVYPGCREDAGGRCQACRAYQAQRVARNRAARQQRQLCTATRSSYDAGCRCAPCIEANSNGCARWRASRQHPDVPEEEVVAA